MMDIFDRIMALRVFQIFEPYYKKHKEGMLYLFFGGLNFFISILTYGVLSGIFGINVLVSNIIAWLFTVSFAYVTNRIWVFGAKSTGVGAIAIEIVRFVSGRIAALAVEEAILLVFVNWLGFGSMAVKMATSILVIIFNYILSKYWIF